MTIYPWNHFPDRCTFVRHHFFLFFLQVWSLLRGLLLLVLMFDHFECRYRAAILTELHNLRSLRRFPGVPSSAAESSDFPVLHLRRRASDWSSFVRTSLFVFAFPCHSLCTSQLFSGTVCSAHYVFENEFNQLSYDWSETSCLLSMAGLSGAVVPSDRDHQRTGTNEFCTRSAESCLEKGYLYLVCIV